MKTAHSVAGSRQVASAVAGAGRGVALLTFSQRTHLAVSPLTVNAGPDRWAPKTIRATYPRVLPRTTSAPIASVPQAAAVGAFFSLEADMTRFPANAVIPRYSKSPEALARLAEALHDHAMHINDEVELSFADQRVALPSPEEIVRKAGW